MPPRLASDQQLRDALEEVFRAARGAVCATAEEAVAAMNAAFRGEGRAHMSDGIVFGIDPSMEEARRRAVRRATELLGPVVGHEKDVASALWKDIAEHVRESDEPERDRVTRFSSKLDELRQIVRDCVIPNRLVMPAAEIEKLTIGPVSAVRGAAMAEFINEEAAGPRWTAAVGEQGFEVGANDTLILNVPDPCWHVKLTASKENLNEQVAWLIGIAVSLLRICCGHTVGYRAPNVGDVEPHPVSHYQDPGMIVLQGRNASVDSGRSVSFYEVGSEAAAICESEEFRDVASQLFAFSENSLAERVSRGLGWLARGRQSNDRSDRFIFFFTAIETILSGQSGSDPVVATVSRSAASILSDDPLERIKIAKDMRDLYAKRSALVHRGLRGVSRGDVNRLQVIAESLFWRVVDRIDLRRTYADFDSSLMESGFGTEWQTDRLSWINY